MNKKWIGLFIILFVSLLAISSVSATTLENRDFDGYFSMNVPKGVSFQKEINDTNESGMKNVFALYSNEHIMVMYFDSILFSENSSSFYYQTFFEAANPDSTKCYESQEGNLKILEPTPKTDLSAPVVGKSSGNKLVIVSSDGDMDSLKSMGHSIKFK